jgi:hypothetical protein
MLWSMEFEGVSVEVHNSDRRTCLSSSKPDSGLHEHSSTSQSVTIANQSNSFPFPHSANDSIPGSKHEVAQFDQSIIFDDETFDRILN